MQVYDKGMHSLLSVLFLLGEQKKKKHKPKKQNKPPTQDIELSKSMKIYPECRNWNGLTACS